MGYESSPGCQRQGIPLSLQYDCLLLLVLNSLSCEEPTPIQPLPTTLIKKLSKTHARQSVFSGILLLVLFWGVTMLTKQASLLWWLSSKESACSAGAYVQSLGQKDPLEEGMATHSSILAWRIPWTQDPGRLQSVGLQRVRHD